LAAQVRLGITLAARSVPAEVKVGDMVWMDGAHVPHQVPWKLAPRWFGPYRVREVKGAACTLDLPETLGKTSDKINIRRLKFFEERDAAFGDYQGPVQPTLDPLGVRRYEIKRIVAHRVFHRRPEYWVQWEGYDAGASFRGTVAVARRGRLSTCRVVCRCGSTCVCWGAAEIGAGVGVACIVFSEWYVCGSGIRTSRAGWSSGRSLGFRFC
jgi:hypothetical protein